MKTRKIEPWVEQIVFIVLGVGCSIWILKYDMILLIPILGIVVTMRELIGTKNPDNKP